MLFVIEKKLDTSFTFVLFEKNKCKKNLIIKVQNKRPKNISKIIINNG